jgi:chemotaxis protein CheX
MTKDQIVEAVRAATTEVFSTMIGIEVEPLEVLSDNSSPSMNDGVMSVVGIAGPWVGNGMFSCNAAFACRVCELFLMTEATSVNDEVLDAVGELANMIIGNFKNAAELVVGPLAITVPTVIYGQNFTSKSLGTNNWIVIPFKAGDDTFEVRAWLTPVPEPTSHRHSVGHLQAV